MHAEFPIERLDDLRGHQPLAVGRVGHDGAASARCLDAARVRTERLDPLTDPGARDVRTGEFDTGGVNIRRIDLDAGRKPSFLRFLARRAPDIRRKLREALGGKMPLRPGGDPVGEHRRLDGNGAGAAHRIPEQHFLPRAAVRRHGGGERLAERGGVRLRAVAALMERHAARVDHQRQTVFEEEELQLVFDALLREVREPVVRGEPLDRGFLDDALERGERGQARADAMPLDGESVVPPDPRLERERPHALEHLVKGRRRERPERDIDALRIAQKDIGERDGLLVPEEGHTPVHRLLAVVAQGIDLLAEQMLEPEKTGRGIADFHKPASPHFYRPIVADSVSPVNSAPEPTFFRPARVP